MKIRCSRSVNQFLEKAKLIWGLEEWQGLDDPEKDILFFGLYQPDDYSDLENSVGNKSIFWCGSDILRMLDDKDCIRIVTQKDIKHYCETEIEAKNLFRAGIKSEIIPSFLGDIKQYPLSFTTPLQGENWKIWLCGHPQREKEYGFDEAKELTRIFKNLEVHLYGVDGINEKNIYYHGLVSEAQLDNDIKKYHCGMRANRHDGVSEVVIKSLLLGQYPISRLPYEDVWQYETSTDLVMYIQVLMEKIEPNYRPRIKWMKKINQFPWCAKNYWKPYEA